MSGAGVTWITFTKLLESCSEQSHTRDPDSAARPEERNSGAVATSGPHSLRERRGGEKWVPGSCQNYNQHYDIQLEILTFPAILVNQDRILANFLDCHTIDDH